MTDPALRPASPPGVDLTDLSGGAVGHVDGVCLDSRSVRPGDLYVGLPGENTHGARFAADAVAAGARAILTDAEGAALAVGVGVPVVVVDDPRSTMGELAARANGDPSKRLRMFGVTGTNGKTSTVFLLEAALVALGERVASIGTIGFRLDGRRLESRRGTVTTPEAPDLQAMLGYMADQGAQSVAMEVSSHALAQNRTVGIDFAVAAFTMFGSDHLDFHHGLDDYFAAKARLFVGGRARVVVINADDAWGRKLIDLVRADGRARVVTTGVADRDADFRLVSAVTRADGSSDVTLATPDGELAYSISMLGDFNVRNSMTALAMVFAAGLDVRRAAPGLSVAQVPGRMQLLDLGPGAPHLVVDFAHTAQAVEAALRALPAGGRHIVVLGAGGDRDRSKREPMGEVAARNADMVIVTDDNPRTEPPASIRAAVLTGARAAASGDTQVVDGGARRDALALALRAARPDDWVAVLGKGHETGQDKGGVITPFDDVEVLRALWRDPR